MVLHMTIKTLPRSVTINISEEENKGGGGRGPNKKPKKAVTHLI